MQTEHESDSTVVLVGLFLGLVFGIFLLLQGVLSALVVLLTSGLGALTGWIIQSVMRGQIDVGGAWRALRQKND